MIIPFVFGFFSPFALPLNQSLLFLLFLLPTPTFFPASPPPAVSLSVLTVHLAPSCRLLLSLFTDPPMANSLRPRPALSYLRGGGGGQPLGRIDRPCKSFGCCNKISSSWDLWGQMHVEEETPTVHEIVKNAKCIGRRKRCPDSWQFLFFASMVCVFFNLSSR